MKTEITELLGIEYPVIQGGMAWVADYHLAAAVSNAGGLGLIAAGGAPAEWVREHHVDESGSRQDCKGNPGRGHQGSDNRCRKSGKIHGRLEGSRS